MSQPAPPRYMHGLIDRAAEHLRLAGYGVRDVRFKYFHAGIGDVEYIAQLTWMGDTSGPRLVVHEARGANFVCMSQPLEIAPLSTLDPTYCDPAHIDNEVPLRLHRCNKARPC